MYVTDQSKQPYPSSVVVRLISYGGANRETAAVGEMILTVMGVVQSLGETVFIQGEVKGK